MSALSAPLPDPSPTRGADSVAARRRPARWADLRFVLGLVLIAASIAGVWAVVALSRQTTPVFVAARTLVPGDRVTPDDLAIVEVALGRVADTYLRSDAVLRDVVAERTITAGELVPRDAVGAAGSTSSTTVVVESSTDVPSSVRTGSTVEVWAAALKEPRSYGIPKILVSEAVVAKVSRDDSMLGSGSASLELVIPRADVADTLAAIATGSAVSVVPTGSAG